MMRTHNINLKAGFLAVAGAIVLSGSLSPVRAAGRVPPSSADGGTPARLGARHAARTPATRIRVKRGTAAASPVNHGSDSPAPVKAPATREADMIAALQERVGHQEELLARQQQQINKLTAVLDGLMSSLRRTQAVPSDSVPEHRDSPAAARSVELVAMRTAGPASLPPGGVTPGAESPHPALIASLDPALSSHVALSAPRAGLAPAVSSESSSQATSAGIQAQTQPYTTRLDNLSKEVDGISKGIAGFRFSGDFRVRSDGIFRSSNTAAGPEQNVRGRYRARLNIDKGIDRQLDIHFQLGSGRFDNALTDDADFAGGAVRGPLFLSEAWVDYHPNSTLNLRGGKMEEVFQDYSRFLWDEDVRLNGFQESVGKSPEDNPLGITRVDFRAGQYILTNPNIQVLPSVKQCTLSTPATTSPLAVAVTTTTVPAACALLQAGYQPGENVRAADLFDQGIFVKGRIKPEWSHYVYTNFALYRNPNQLALASTSAGLPALVNNVTGVTLAGPLTGTGTATTIPGGGIFTASHFQIGHVAYRITKEGWRFRGEDFPVFLDVQASRNFGTSFQRNAWIATINAGEIKKAGDVRFLYLYVVKEANSMVSQFTDDHVGTLTGVNIRTHAFRFDLGLTKFLQWQNIFYIQNEISGNDPVRHFYVPVPAGTPTQFRIESSLFVNF